MKMSRTAIKELTAAYRAVLKHAFIAAMGAMVVIGGASAENTNNREYITADTEWSDKNISNNDFKYAEGRTDKNKAFGGLAFVDRAKLTVVDSVFDNNTFDYVGGVFATGVNDGSVLDISGSTFSNNHNLYDGGAIGGYGVLKVTNSTFVGNTTDLTKDAEGNYTVAVEDNLPVGGGAISFGAVSSSDIASINDTKFINNVSGINGGAIGTRLGKNANNSAAKLNVSATFEGNRAYQNGGAIYNTFYANNGMGLGDGVTVSGKFTKNSAGENGGAIFNDGAKDKIGNAGGVMTIRDSVFSENTATHGGAIYNTGQLTISNSEFYKNIASGNKAEGGAIYNTGGLTLSNVKFTGNSVNGYSGGAVSINVKNGEKTKILNSEFVGNTASGEADSGAVSIANGDVDIKASKFIGNKADFGGALYAYTGNKHYVAVHIEDSLFSGNVADWEGNASDDGGGAIVNVANANPDSAAAKENPNQYGMWIKNSRFENNKVLNNNPGGGAMFLGSTARTNLDGVLFRGNSSDTVGGAVSTRFADSGKNDNRGVIDIINTVFANNTAKQTGGAFDNYFHNSDTAAGNVYIEKSSFDSNSAKQGGAVYNHGDADKQGKAGSMMFTGVNFMNNVATENGGALFNEANAQITLAGENTFTGNMAGGVGNDIYNLGKLTVSDGTTTIDGGIAGDGALTIADGATLNIGTTTVQQKELTLDGTVGATIVGANNYGKLLAETYKGNGKVSLNVATTGTYNIFGENANEYTVVDAGAIYDVTKGDNGAITIATKNVEEIAKETGLTDIAANTVAALANADNDLANIASLNAQQALRNGDTDYVEIESAKANPIDQPVVQSVAQSVQSAVMTLAANRMAGTPSAGTMGRSGGDLSDADYGVWAQGMFNKSKFNGQFNGYTRGVSAGFDALIDKQYTIGLGYAFGHSDVHANGGRDTEIDSNTIFAYAQYKPSEWFVNAALNYTMSKYTETVDAFGVRLKADYDTDAFGGQVMTGYDFASGLTPEIGLRYLHVTQDSYNNGLNHVSSDDTDFLTGIAGMKYRFAIENDSVINWFPELRAAATYDFVSDKAMSTVTMPGAASYVVDGDRLSRFGGEFGIGLTAEYNGLEVSLVYDLNLHKDYTSQTGMAKFRYEF